METCFICFLLVLAATLGAPVQSTPESCQAVLKTQLQNNLLIIRGECVSTSPQPLSMSYELLTDKQGASASSHNVQSGQFTVASQQRVTLAQTALRIAPADAYRIRLRLLTATGEVVAQDSLSFPAEKQP